MIISGVICRKWFGTGNRCNFVDELRVKRRAAFPLPKCCPYIFSPCGYGRKQNPRLENEIFLLCFLSGAFTALISALLFHGNQRIFSGLKGAVLKSFIRNYTTDIKND